MSLDRAIGLPIAITRIEMMLVLPLMTAPAADAVRLRPVDADPLAAVGFSGEGAGTRIAAFVESNAERRPR